ncbi:MAG: ribosome-associated translation inhibitor RaiA [Kiritimatiellae bacterium]|nr:ribosome-associated translation inhibitor RaiA [Kiritimatiellia bacterium]
MSIEVTIRHMKVPKAIQSYVTDKMEALSESFPRIEHIHVILDHEKRSNVAEIVVKARNHIHIEAEESSENLRAAIDVATEKAERQLRKLRDKVQDHRPRAARKNGDLIETVVEEEFEGGVL